MSMLDESMVFMGFCPSANMANRLDVEWRADGVCYLHEWSAPGFQRQANLFLNITPGDVVVMKKRQEVGKTMRLFGHGKVVAVRYAKHPDRLCRELVMDWSPQTSLIDIPLMGCNDTVNVRKVHEMMAAQVPAEFYQWLMPQEALYPPQAIGGKEPVGLFRRDRCKALYEPNTTANGNKGLDCGDEVAVALRGLEINTVYAIAADRCQCSVSNLKDLYAHLNVGLQRAALGNRIRGAGGGMVVS